MLLEADEPVEQLDWDEIEERFRLWSFYVYYRKTFAGEVYPLKRFVKALLASARPIRDRQLVIEWHRQSQERRMRTELACAGEQHA